MHRHIIFLRIVLFFWLLFSKVSLSTMYIKSFNCTYKQYKQVHTRNYHTIHRPQYRPFQTPVADPSMHHRWMDRRMGSDPVGGHWTAELESGDTQATV